MQEPPYSMTAVEPARRDLSGTSIVRLEGRTAWLPHLAEMLLLCNEASKRFLPKYTFVSEPISPNVVNFSYRKPFRF